MGPAQEPEEGELLRTLKGHTGPVYSVAVSPDGGTIVSGSLDMTVRLRRAAGGALLRTLEGHTKWVRSVAVSPGTQHRLQTGPRHSTECIMTAQPSNGTQPSFRERTLRNFPFRELNPNPKKESKRTFPPRKSLGRRLFLSVGELSKEVPE